MPTSNTSALWTQLLGIPIFRQERGAAELIPRITMTLLAVIMPIKFLWVKNTILGIPTPLLLGPFQTSSDTKPRLSCKKLQLDSKQNSARTLAKESLATP